MLEHLVWLGGSFNCVSNVSFENTRRIFCFYLGLAVILLSLKLLSVCKCQVWLETEIRVFIKLIGIKKHEDLKDF